MKEFLANLAFALTLSAASLLFFEFLSGIHSVHCTGCSWFWCSRGTEAAAHDIITEAAILNK